MNPNPSPDPSDELQQYKQALLTLLAKAEAEADAVADRFDQIVGKLERLIALLESDHLASDHAPGSRGRGAILSLAKECLKAARDGQRHAIAASGMTEQASERLGSSAVEVVPGERIDPSSLNGPEVRAVAPAGEVRNRAGRIAGHKFSVNGIRHTFSATQGALFAALCADDGESDDRFVAFKSRQDLEEKLGVSTNLLHTQVHRLRDKLENHHGHPRDLLETDPVRGYRIRLVRKAPGLRRAGL